MEFFKTIRLRLINKVFYILKCSYPCEFTMWHFQHYPAERGPFDLTSPTRNEKTMTIVYSALPLVNSPHLLATMKVFLHPVIFQWNISRAPKFTENALLPSFNECRSASESKQAFYKKNIGRIDQKRKQATSNVSNSRLLGYKSKPYLVETQCFPQPMTKPEVPPT